MKTQKTVLLALSGGVDSSVAALLLKKQGYNVIAAFMKNFSDSKNPITNECSWIAERQMAIKITAILKIPLTTLDFEKQYKKCVIEPMYKAYRNALTPNPDIICNTIIKFPLLWKHAKKIKADYIATGHYTRIKKTKKGFELHMSRDKSKDQSYFLAELSQNDLSHTLFPIGGLKKAEVREIAKKNRFPNFDKKSTRGICFVGKTNMKGFLEKKIKNKIGKIKDPEGNIIGTHPGIFYYTIGQRIGPSIGLKINKHLNGKWYIAEKHKDNTLIIAPKGHQLLKKQTIKIMNFHQTNPKEKIPNNIKARIRNLSPLYPGKLKKIKDDYFFAFSKPLEQIAEGQYIVLYQNTKLIASGEIRHQ